MSDMFALQAIALIGKSLAAAVKDGGNADARADVALANTLAGFVETLSSCSGEHAIEHALSAFHPDLPHGAGLIMLSKHTGAASRTPRLTACRPLHMHSDVRTAIFSLRWLSCSRRAAWTAAPVRLRCKAGRCRRTR